LMKICFVGPASNYHMIKWCAWFVERKHDVHVVSFIQGVIDNVEVHYVDTSVNAGQSDIKKLNYLFKAKEIEKIIKDISPDVISVHYASSYGAVMALTNIKKYVLSVWGSDIYDFPQKSIFHRILIRYSLYRAKCLLSTSKAMAAEASKYTNKRFFVTPFGVDMDLFRPDVNKGKREEFVLGTVKTLEDKYGIDYLLKAVAILHKEHPEVKWILRIAGKGSKEVEYKKLAVELGIQDIVTWLGYISQTDAAKEWANMDLAVVYSTLESFGVSAVEANSCGVPVIIADIPGLMEATKPGETSIVVQRKQEGLLADAIYKIYEDDELRNKMSDKSRMFVRDNYEIDDCFLRIENLLAKQADCR
ncbi:MAG: glycosyltransferase, partial [Bacillota bacterium]|nr:glycosyltransferase [Bacillota bacterium]